MSRSTKPQVPYRYDGWAAPEFTLERPERLDLLESVEAKRRVYIDGPRRCGKTTLVVNTLEGAGIPVLRIDLEGIASRERLSERIASSVNVFLNQNGKARDRLLSTNRVKAGVASNLLGVLSLKIESEKVTQSRQPEQTIDSLLCAVNDIAHITGAAVFIDEFQSVKDPKFTDAGEVMGAFATVSDPERTRNNASFVFAGSNRHAMHEIFNSADSYFFRRTENIPVGPLPEKQIIPFLSGRFDGTVPDPVGHEAYLWTEGITGDLQRLYSRLSQRADRSRSKHFVVTDDDMKAAQSLIVADLGRSYALTLLKLSEPARIMLDIIAGHNIRSIDRLREHALALGLSVDACNAALKELLQTGNLHISLQPGDKTIERPEPGLFHYLLKQPAVTHTPYDRLFSETSDQIKKLNASFESSSKSQMTPDLGRP